MTTDATWSPACMTEDEYALWCDNRVPLPLRFKAERPCHDCPIGYALEMRAQGRCNGTPEGVEEDDVIDAPPTIQASHQRTEVELPCPRCVHRPVCAIKPTLEEHLVELRVVGPDLPKGVVIALQASVDCSHFTKDRGEHGRVRTQTRWSPARETELLDAIKRHGGIAAAASALGISKGAAGARVSRLRELDQLPADVEAVISSARMGPPPKGGSK